MALDTQKFAGKGAGTMFIKILKNTVCGGKAVAAGSEVEASDWDARLLIGRGKAEPATPKKKAPAKKPPLQDKAIKSEELDTRD